ncbi:hypothetical protein BDY19DRAFT_457969 [Irpex rosettiformis]|uniref:Uncharacterized protein n=1 Tax=Irpex rosettiformis TaxID=378272 RepID=A0ACB8TSV4_9APHY|nr:hypothetical protein BDY19DRAFT_457969 [Irpex rosettiformis]
MPKRTHPLDIADPPSYQPDKRASSLSLLAIFVLFNLWYISSLLLTPSSFRNVISVPLHAQETLEKCRALHIKPGVPEDFHNRVKSDRYEEGTTKTVIIRNATVWTGGVKGLEVVKGDVLLEGGIIKSVGVDIDEDELAKLEGSKDMKVINGNGRWLTPGIIDVHSHLGVGSSPELHGASDGNSFKGPILPWLRSLDGINTHDDGYANAVAGGLTTALILPGSANAIGGQGFVIKPRPTKERSPTSFLLEPPFNLNSSYEGQVPSRWRHIKHACGENPSSAYQNTRMDTAWAFRQAYDTARKIKDSQDEYCEKALAGDWDGVAGKEFPESLQWEALVDVLRGRVKVQTHCYEAIDIDNFVRLSNEFQFPVAAFHHAHEAWLVPDVLKRAYEHPPAIAMFAAFARYKREGYRHSEFAPRILADNDIDVVMKSDHNAIVSRYLIHEAAQAHYWGLDENIALASVTTTSAKVLGLEHRIGYVKVGYDADVVLWDSHPLALGATPVQVFIDGIPQIANPHTVFKPAALQSAPETPNYDKEAEEAIRYEGLPPLLPLGLNTTSTVVFANISSIFSRDRTGNVVEKFVASSTEGRATVVVQDGQIVCEQLASSSSCDHFLPSLPLEYRIINLKGGTLQPGLVSAGSSIGLSHISLDDSTSDGQVYNPLVGPIPSIAGGDGYLARAVDGLQFASRDALLAYRAGVTTAVTSPQHASFVGGLSTAFALGALYGLEVGAVVRNVVALHVTLAHGDVPGISTEIAALRKYVLHPPSGDAERLVGRLRKGEIPLVVGTNNADIIATIVNLKEELEAEIGNKIKVTIVGGAEAHILAQELARADVGVLLTPPRPYPYTWDHRRVLAGLPLTNESAIAHLVRAGVTVGLGPQGIQGSPLLSSWAVRNARFDAGWALLDSPDLLSRSDAYALVSSNVEKLFGLRTDPYQSDLVASEEGDLLSFEGKVRAVISSRRKKVDIFE